MSDSLWTIEEIIDATGGRLSSDISLSVNGISIDTRTLNSGDAFFALSGSNSDGHNFVKHAFEKGASLAVVSKDFQLELEGFRSTYIR